MCVSLYSYNGLVVVLVRLVLVEIGEMNERDQVQVEEEEEKEKENKQQMTITTAPVIVFSRLNKRLAADDDSKSSIIN